MATATERKPVIKSSDMTEEMQQDAVNTAVQVTADSIPLAPHQVNALEQSTCSTFSRLSSQALDKFTIEKDVAAYIKKEFDSKHNPTWHCIVGRNFGEVMLLSLLGHINCVALFATP